MVGAGRQQASVQSAVDDRLRGDRVSAMTALLAIVTVLAFGTWIPLAQVMANVPQRLRTFYVTAGNFAFATVAFVIGGSHMSFGWREFWLPFAGGLVWTEGNYSAFRASEDIGLARGRRFVDSTQHNRRLRVGGTPVRGAGRLHQDPLQCPCLRAPARPRRGVSRSRRYLRPGWQGDCTFFFRA